MLELYKNIKRRRQQLKMTQTDLALKMGYADKSMIAKIEKGNVDLPQSKILAFANALETTPGELMGWDYETEATETVDNIYKLDKIKLPFLGKVACGEPIFADEDRESYIMVGTDIGADFCLQCQGDSMINARIHDGDIVFVKKTDIVENGEIAVVIIDDEATLKRFFYYREQNLVILKPENPKYQDIILTGEQLNQVRVIGRAVAFQSDVI
ncbi:MULTISPECIES: LexA family transcriptional regulator [Catenibacterium]|uniref:LexA family protein n=1 Tax=unclassified Catenibacterium TaxID=2643636 RepID=UPI00136A34D1|nr:MULTISPECIES: LexA family transcriptional regulator [Catenibacterium]MZT11253.1 helix-turn-helix domain-containing protein [Catenibacterium sp. BIOML-A1]